MKKNIWKRIASLALTLALVVGLLPQKAAAAERFQGFGTYGITITDVYLLYPNSANARTMYSGGRLFSGTTLTIKTVGAPVNGKVTVQYDFSVSEYGSRTGTFSLDCSCDKTYSFNSLPEITLDNGYSLSIHMEKAAASHNMSNTSNGDNTHSITCSLCKETSKENCSGASGVNCITTGTCTTCNGQYHNPSVHAWTYSASGNVVTASCACGNVGSSTATLKTKSNNYSYTGSPITNFASITYSDGWPGEKPQPVDSDYYNNINTGTATVKTSIEGKEISTTFRIVRVSMRDVPVTMTPASGIYTGNVHPYPNYTLTYNGKALTLGTDYNEVGGWTGNFIDAGTYQLNLEGKGNFTGKKTLTYTIGKAAPTAQDFVITLPTDLVYDGEAKTASAEVKTGIAGMGNVTVAYYDADGNAVSERIDAGTYTVTVDVTAGKNYNKVNNLTVGSFTVAPTAGSIIIPANQSVTYDGAPVEYNDLNPTITADGALTVKWYDSEGTEIAAPTNVGTYQIGISAAAGNNYEAVDEVKQTFTIAKANPIYTAPTANNGLVYNGREQELTAYVPSIGGTVYYSLDGINYTEFLPKGINAQEYTVYYKIVGDENHNDIKPQTVTARIAPVNIETTSRKAGVLGGPFTYNGQKHTPVPQLDVFVNDYPVSGTPNAPGADVRLTEGIDYSVTYSDNVNAGQAVVTFTGKGNYTGTITTKFTIAPKPITVTIADKTSVYGEAVAELTATTDGIVNNDTNVYSLATTATSTANAGTYAITGTTLDANYDITFEIGTYTITKANAAFTAPTANTLTYDGSEQTLIVAGSTGDGTMVYSLEKEGEYTAELPKAKTAGTYHVWYKVIGDGNHNDSAPASVEVKIDKADPGIGAVTAGVVENTLDSGAIVLTRENTDIPGTLAVDAEQTLAVGDNTIRYTFTPNDTTNYKVVKDEVAVTVVDTVAPTGAVTVSTKSWAEFLNNITFGLFFKETQTVSVTVSDNLSGVTKIEYIESKTTMDLDTVKAAEQWTEMENGSVSVTLEDTKQFIYYIRITDKSGNIAYLSSDGAEYDTTAPVIAGVNNGVTYYTTQAVAVADKNIDTITLNDEAATGSITLEGNKEATYTIVATDKAGNSTTITVKMAPIADIVSSMEGKSDANVTSDDKAALQEIVDTANKELSNANATQAEKDALKDAKAEAEALLDAIEEAAKAADTENTAKVEEVTADNVKPEDKDALENAKSDLEKALEDNSDNYTEEEKQAIQDALDRIDNALAVITNVEAVENAISDLTATVEPDDEETIAKIEEAKKAYDGLTEYEKSLVDKKTKEKLDDLTAAAVAYKIVKGDKGKWIKGGESGLSFIANGPLAKFSSIEIDGKAIDAKHYDAAAGSTIITLKASYLETLSAGEHTITVVYTDGETSGTFKIQEEAASLAMGNGLNIILYSSIAVVILAALVVLILVIKKRKQAS